jgi:hypothetical protein
MDALLRCTTAEDQVPAATLRSAVDALSNTIAAVHAGTKSFADLRRYRVSVTLPTPAADDEIDRTQRASLHPLPPHHCLEIRVALADPAVAPTTKARRGADFAYAHTFNLGERTARQVERLRASDVEFRIFRRPTALTGPKGRRPGSARYRSPSIQPRRSIFWQWTAGGPRSSSTTGCQ